jgi:hypothetical protein
LRSPKRFDFGVAARVMAARKRNFVTGAPAGEIILVRGPCILGAAAGEDMRP